MKSTASTLSTLLFAVLALFGCSSDQSADNAETTPEPIAQVQTVKLEKTLMNKTISAFGVVLPSPDKLQTISLPFNCEIENIQVTDGQLVQRGDFLLTVKSAADANLQLAQAKQELVAATQEHKLLKSRVELQLGTQQELVTSQLRIDQAKALINNLKDRGVGVSQQIRAQQTGMVHLVSVQQGQLVPAGNPLLQLVDQNQWLVRLGIEPEDAENVQIKQTVLITPANKPSTQAIKGRVETITQQLDPTTRLLNVFVRPESNQQLLINDFVQAKIILSSTLVLAVPRLAVLPDGDAYSLYTAVNGHAVKHRVQTGLENDQQVAVIAEDLNEQDDIVVQGNYELEDGMAVEVKP